MFFTNIYKGIFVNKSLAGTGIHEYGYYNTHTRPINMRVSKIPVPAGNGYPFLIFVSYPLRVLSADTRGYGFFWHPDLMGVHHCQAIQTKTQPTRLQACVAWWPGSCCQAVSLQEPRNK